MTYGFYGWENAVIEAVHPLPGIVTPRELYTALQDVWCAETCAPRLKKTMLSECIKRPDLRSLTKTIRNIL